MPCRDRHPSKARAKASEEGALSLRGNIGGRSGRLDETTALECGVMVGSCCVYCKVDRGVGSRRDEGWERVTVILACSGWSRSCVRVRMKREGDEVGDAVDEMCRMDVSGIKVRRDNNGSDTDSCCCYCFWLVLGRYSFWRPPMSHARRSRCRCRTDTAIQSRSAERLPFCFE